MTRLEICRAFASRQVTLVGVEWVTDIRLEDAYHAWLREGSPTNVVVAVEYNAEGKESVRIEPEEVPELL